MHSGWHNQPHAAATVPYLGRRRVPSSLAEMQKPIPDIGATRADADQMLSRMRTRPNFEGYLRDGMYWARLSAQLLDGVAISAEELDTALSQELVDLRQ